MTFARTATLLLLIDDVFSRTELIIDQRNQLLITPPDFSLEVPPGATVLMGLELHGVSAPDFRPSPDLHRAFGHGWHVRDAWRSAPGDSGDGNLEPGDVYTLSYDLSIEALLPPQVLPPRRVLDSALLSEYAEAQTGSLPIKGAPGLNWVQVFDFSDGAGATLLFTFHPPLDGPGGMEQAE